MSLRCCSDSNFTDQITSINWTPDDSWFPNKTGCRDEPIEAWKKHKDHGTARIFNIDSGKRCYKLTTIKEQDYGEGEMKMALKFHLVVVQLIKKKLF